MCSAPNVYMFVYILIGTHMVPLIKTGSDDRILETIGKQLVHNCFDKGYFARSY